MGKLPNFFPRRKTERRLNTLLADGDSQILTAISNLNLGVLDPDARFDACNEFFENYLIQEIVFLLPREETCPSKPVHFGVVIICYEEGCIRCNLLYFLRMDENLRVELSTAGFSAYCPILIAVSTTG